MAVADSKKVIVNIPVQDFVAADYLKRRTALKVDSVAPQPNHEGPGSPWPLLTRVSIPRDWIEDDDA